MDIFNRPPSIAEDTVQYAVYPPEDMSNKAFAMTLAACITSFVETTLSDFIWHRDAFEVKVVPNHDTAGSWIIEGRMRVGDCIDDEWCTVWLLKEISSKWDVVIRLYDSDGEFLLIEAAEALPPWVTPTNSENRVWIYNSRLHLVPLTYISPSYRERRRKTLDSDDESLGVVEDDEFIAAVDGLKVVRDPLIDTFAPGAEKAVWRRISGYPAAFKSHVHKTKAFISRDIIKALTMYPTLIQRAVEAFYTRDSIQLRVAHRMSRFPPNSAVLATVKMTRTAYAQLSGQKFFPPKVFGQWKESEGSDTWRRKDIGMKISVGFEMLYQESKSRQSMKNMSPDGITSSAEATKDVLQGNPEYQKYIENLISANYFKGEIRGSATWQILENKAAATFVEIRRADDISRPSFASQVDAAVSGIKELPEPLDQGEDSEDWLTIDADNFDKMLEETLGKKKSKIQPDTSAVDAESTESAEDQLVSEQAKQFVDLANKVESFVEGEGDMESARFEDEEFSDEAFSEDDASEAESDEASPVPSKRRSVEQQVAMDYLVPALDPSEYGKMPPSYHIHSQPVAPATLLTDVEEAPSKESGIKTDTGIGVKPLRSPIIPRDRYDGVDSDDETDIEDEESDEERPEVVGEIEIDMKDEEEEFLEFSRQELGISDEHWASIIEDRKQRGAFLPSSITQPSKSLKKSSTEKQTERAHEASNAPSLPQQRPNANRELNSFEAVMKALDDVLAQNQSPSKAFDTAQKLDAKGKTKATIEDEMAVEEDLDFDIEAAMEAELKQKLKKDDTDFDESLDYNLIKNFLESFKSQAGLSGPVSNLAGRLAPDMRFPRDAS